MNTKYIKQCEKAAEMQDDGNMYFRKWGRGNLWFNKNWDTYTHNPFFIIAFHDGNRTTHIDVEEMYWNYNRPTRNRYDPCSDLVREGGFWLPRLGQLQDMIDSSCTLNLIGLFDDWLSGECFQPDVPATVFRDMYEGASMEMLWLAFVMDRNFQKIWSDESEDWKINREEKTLRNGGMTL